MMAEVHESGESTSKLVRGYAISTAVGGLYGATNTLVGHPFDTIKTKMQAEARVSLCLACCNLVSKLTQRCSHA